jgi:hypothetical protein
VVGDNSFTTEDAGDTEDRSRKFIDEVRDVMLSEAELLCISFQIHRFFAPFGRSE